MMQFIKRLFGLKQGYKVSFRPQIFEESEELANMFSRQQKNAALEMLAAAHIVRHVAHNAHKNGIFIESTDELIDAMANTAKTLKE